MKLGQGYIFTGVCDSVHRGGGLPQCKLRYHLLPAKETPLARQTPPGQGDPPPARQTPLRSACWEIRSTSGRYTSYWNAILVHLF